MDYLYLYILVYYRRDKIEYFLKVEFEMKCFKNCYISDVIDNIIKEKKICRVSMCKLVIFDL